MSLVLGQKAEFSPTVEKKGLGADAISTALFSLCKQSRCEHAPWGRGGVSNTVC